MKYTTKELIRDVCITVVLLGLIFLFLGGCMKHQTHIEIPITVYYDYQPEEPATLTYPGCPAVFIPHTSP